jgi:DNA-binding response OmpR family regulator
VSAKPPVVLYTEDNYLLMRTVRDVLELAGCRVEHYTDGMMALAALQCAGARGRHYDLLLLDQDLPSLSGVELARGARKLAAWRQTPIILLSLEDCDAAAREAGVDEFLRKPHNLLTLADRVRQLLAERRVAPAAADASPPAAENVTPAPTRPRGAKSQPRRAGRKSKPRR